MVWLILLALLIAILIGAGFVVKWLLIAAAAPLHEVVGGSPLISVLRQFGF